MDQRDAWNDVELPPVLEPLRPHIEASLRPCLSLKPAAPAAGSSVRGNRLGGEPGLDPRASWPAGERGPMTFIGQLDFDELSRSGVPELGLPASGILAFFYDLSRAPTGGHAAEMSSLFRLCYTAGEASMRAPPEGATPLPQRELPVAALELSMPHEWDLATRSWPSFDQQFDETTMGWTGPRPEYRGLYDGGRNQVRGCANWVQQDPRIEGVRIDASRLEILPDPAGWSLLWQLSYQPSWGLRFWSEIESSRLFILIRDEDLAAKDFSRTYLAWQCV